MPYMLIAYLDCNDEGPSVSDPQVFPQIPTQLNAQKPENSQLPSERHGAQTIFPEQPFFRKTRWNLKDITLHKTHLES